MKTPTSIERFKTITDFPDYEISNHGRVISHKRPKPLLMKLHTDPHGYKYVILSGLGKNKIYSIHKLVQKFFIRKSKTQTVVNHIDFDKTNNHVDNLENCTQKQNVQHSVENGRLIQVKKYAKRAVRIYDPIDDITYITESITAACKALLVSHNVVGNALRGNQKSVRGCIVSFA